MRFVGKKEDTAELTEKEIIRAERNSGIVSGKLREIQVSFHACNYNEACAF